MRNNIIVRKGVLVSFITITIKLSFLLKKVNPIFVLLSLLFLRFFFAIFEQEIGWLLKITSTIFIFLQLYGLSIRLMLPIDSTEPFRMLHRILTLFFAIVLTAIYSFILILYSRKLTASSAMSAADSIGDGSVEAGGEGDDGSNAATAL